MREELAASETQFEAQCLETKRILEEEIAKMWAGSEEQFRKMRAELPQLELSEGQDSESAAKLLDEAIGKARNKLIEGEAKVRGFMADAEKIIGERQRP